MWNAQSALLFCPRELRGYVSEVNTISVWLVYRWVMSHGLWKSSLMSGIRLRTCSSIGSLRFQMNICCLDPYQWQERHRAANDNSLNRRVDSDWILNWNQEFSFGGNTVGNLLNKPGSPDQWQDPRVKMGEQFNTSNAPVVWKSVQFLASPTSKDFAVQTFQAHKSRDVSK